MGWSGDRGDGVLADVGCVSGAVYGWIGVVTGVIGEDDRYRVDG